MDFRLLGGVEAFTGSRPVDLGHARQRCVLVALLVQVDRPVQVARLIGQVWGEHPPQRARDTLYGYMSRLRRLLTESESESGSGSGSGSDAESDACIVRRHGGYALITDPLNVDLHRFRDLARQARAADDDEQAAALFEGALGLWRGDAFGTLDTPWLDALRVTLAQERLAAELDSNDVALRRGRHHELLPALQARADTHPLDERLAGQLMLALYRCRRPAEALAHYRSTRLRLADESGLDPSASLQQLHQRILTADPRLTPRDGPAPPTGTTGKPPHALPPVPTQLPASVSRLAGRSRELAALTRHLDTIGPSTATTALVSIAGSAGIGKTTLALCWARQVCERFPDGQLYVNLRGFDPGGAPMAPPEAMRGFLESLGVPAESIPTTADAQAGLFRTLVAGKRLLVILDDAHDSDQVRPLLPGSGTCLVIVTSRRQLPGLLVGGHTRHLTLGLLGGEEARELLADILGRRRVAAESEAVASIIDRCAHLPLALSIAAARAASTTHLPLSMLAEELHDERNRITALSTGDSRHTDLSTVFSWSYQALSAPAARLFRLLGLHAGPDIAVPAAAALVGLPRERTRALLAELTTAHLLHHHTPGRYQFHDLLRAYAADRTRAEDPAGERDAALHRVLTHYVHTACAADRLLDPHRDPLALGRPCSEAEALAGHDQALDWFAAQSAVLPDAVRHAARSGHGTLAWQLAWAMTTFLQRAGHWRTWVSTQRVALESARDSGDRDGQAHSHHGLGFALARTGDHDDARRHLTQALDQYAALGDNPGLAHTHRTMAWVCQRTGRHRQALHHAERTLAYYRAADYLPGEASALNAIGWYRAQLGDHHGALADCEQALDLFRKVGNRTGEAYTWDSLGFIHRRLGRYRESATCYEQALSHFRALGDRSSEAETLIGLAETHRAAGHVPPARDTCRNALALSEELGLPGAHRIRELLAELERRR
ncbi:BTAD domain-containing putative transcriptional regulator [Streptomyces sp. NPDC021356]|uniref:AfsR/SARP family transcriptional regulator n=1 Tax=Streptomyces sp. NPDC021356 TaxID=3154900 RepID=UPI0033CC07B4